MRSCFPTWSCAVIACIAAVSSLVLAGCPSSRTGPGPGVSGTPIPFESFCAEVMDAVCDSIAACGCSSGAEAECRSEALRECEPDGTFGSELSASIAAGRVIYDANSAGAVVAELRAATGCQHPLSALSWTLGDVLTFGGVFTGTIAPGGACTVGGDKLFFSECAGGSCVATGGSGTGPGTCIGLVGLGDRCIATSQVCIDLDVPIDITDEGLEGDALLRCVPDAPGGTSGTCQARLEDGATCTNSFDCASSRCISSACAPPLAVGATCSGSAECETGFCDNATATCARGDLPLGSACASDDACASGGCSSDSVCIEALCDLYGPSSGSGGAAPPPAP